MLLRRINDPRGLPLPRRRTAAGGIYTRVLAKKPLAARTKSSWIKNRRGRTNDLHVFAAFRMGEADLPGMEEIAGIPGCGGSRAVDTPGTRSPPRHVERVSH
jgi:hypothetical protein